MKTKPIELPSQRSPSGFVKVIAEAFDPEVIIGPPVWELFNCTTCRYGTESEVNKRDVDTFRCWCKWAPCMGWKKGPRREHYNKCDFWTIAPLMKQFRKDYEKQA
jgi:hypothetical protein